MLVTRVIISIVVNVESILCHFLVFPMCVSYRIKTCHSSLSNKYFFLIGSHYQININILIQISIASYQHHSSIYFIQKFQVLTSNSQTTNQKTMFQNYQTDISKKKL